MKKILLLVSIVLLLGSCSSKFSSSGEKVYVKSRNAELLVVAPPLTKEYLSSYYVLPNPKTA